MDKVKIRTLRDLEGKHPDWPDYWLAWADGVQGDGLTEQEAINDAVARLIASRQDVN